MKKFVGSLIIIALLALSIVGLVFGLKYKNLKNHPLNDPGVIEQLEEYKSLSNKYYAELAETQKIVLEKNKAITDLEIKEKEKDNALAEKQAEINSLQKQIEEKDTLISNKNAEIAALQASLSTSEDGNNEKQTKINQLRAEVATLTEEKAALQNEKSDLQDSVTVLQQEKKSLQNEKIQLQSQLAQEQQHALELQNEVTRLTGLIAGYEDIKNGTHEVDFYIEYPQTVLYVTKVVRNGNCVADLVTPEDTDDYRFDGWSLDKVNAVDPLTVEITEDTTFYALVTPKYTVAFVNSEGETISSMQRVAKGEMVVFPEVSVEGSTFEGWYIGDVKVDTSNYVISSNVTFRANFIPSGFIEKDWGEVTDFYGVSTINYGGNTYLVKDKSLYELDKSTLLWVSKGELTKGFSCRNVWTDGEHLYAGPGNGVGCFTVDLENLTVSNKIWGISDFYNIDVWTDGEDVYYSHSSSHYKLNKSTGKFVSKAWNGLTSFYGKNVWTDGKDVYCSNSTDQYRLNRETNTWVAVTWEGQGAKVIGQYVWSDGENIYQFTASGLYQLKLNKQTNSWDEFVWFGDLGVTYYDGIWTDGKNIYYSYNGSHYIYR